MVGLAVAAGIAAATVAVAPAANARATSAAPPAQSAGAAAPALVTGLEQVTARSFDDSKDRKSVRAYCPAGKRVVGGTAIAAPEDGVFVRITNQFPYFDLVTGQQSFFDVSATEEEVSSTGDWTLVVTAVCANPLPGQMIASGFSIRSSAQSQTATATCPAGKKVLGGFGSIHEGLRE